MTSAQDLQRFARRNRILPRKLRFTREGKFYILITFGIGFAASNTGNNLLYLLLGMLLSVILLSGFLSEMAIHGARVVRLSSPEWFAKTPGRTALEIHNANKRFSAYSLSAREVFLDPGVDQQAAPLLHLGAGQRQATPLGIVFGHRGLFTSFGLRVETAFPFSLFVKARVFEAVRGVIVYPQLLADAALVEALRLLAGDSESLARVGRGGDLYGVRDFREGDSQARIAWKLTARRGHPVVREFEDLHGREARVLLVPAGRDPERAEAAISLAATLVERLTAEGARVALLTTEKLRVSTRPLVARSEALSHLAEVGVRDDPDAAWGEARVFLDASRDRWLVVVPERTAGMEDGPSWSVVAP